jgi:hypothetical protein
MEKKPTAEGIAAAVAAMGVPAMIAVALFIVLSTIL